MGATVLPHARLSQLSRSRLETLLQLSQAFNSTVDVDSLLPRILELTLAVTESEAGSLWVREGDRLRCTHAAGPAAARLRGQEHDAADGVLGEALRTRAPVLVADALDDPRFALYADVASGFRTRSAVTIPLVAVGEPLGAIQLVNDVGGKDEFDEEDVAFLESLADDAAAALRNARLFEAERRARNLQALLEVSHEITATFDVDRILYSIVNLADRAVPFERCLIAVWQGGELRMRAISGEDAVDRKSAAVREVERFLAWGAERGDPLWIDDVHATGDADAAAVSRLFASYLEHARAAGLLLLPIMDAEGPLGVLLFEFAAPGAVDEWEREAAQLLAHEAALALRNAQLYADVPFIAWLEPLAQKRRALLAMPGTTWLWWGLSTTALFALLVLLHVPLRLTSADALVHAAVQRPVHAGAAGVIEDVFVREGDRVAAGTPIARLRNEQLLRRLADGEGDLRLAERQGLAAEAAGDAAGAAAARVRVAQQREAVALLQREAAALQVLAPTAGIVLTPRLEERIGSYRAAGEPIAWIGDPDSAEIRMRVAQHDVSLVRTQDRVRVRVPARPELRFDGTVYAIAPLAELRNDEPLYTVRARLDNSAQVLRPGMHARARVLTEARPLGYVLLRRPWRWIRMNLWW